MPKEFEVRDFGHFEELCLKLGFLKIPADELKNRLRQLNVKTPRCYRNKGLETGFEFRANGLTIVVWTTYVESKKTLREKGTDAGWILIIQDGERAYSSHPITRRSERFLTNLYRRVWINWCRVLRRPRCPECNEFMKITRGRHLKQRYWSCDRRDLHPSGKKTYQLGFNFALPEKAKEFLKKVYKEREKYNEQLKKDGKQPHVAMLRRKKWAPTA